jgi:predicted nucleic acid-binding protein
LKKVRSEPLLTNFIVAECHALALARLGASLARNWLLANVWAVERVTDDDEAKAKEIIRKYVDKSFSYTDATSFAVMERLGLRTAFALDPHFRQYGFQVIGLPQS